MKSPSVRLDQRLSAWLEAKGTKLTALAVGWALAAVIVVLTWGPVTLRPHYGHPQLERFVAYLALGSVFSVGYHSHVLEHLDRNLAHPSHDPALLFITECRRALRQGGVLRVVVPNLERVCREYLEHVASCEADPSQRADQDRFIFHILGQEVRREAFGSSNQNPIQRRIENLLLGDARKRGETHQWEYDRFNLAHLMAQAGFEDIRVVDYRTSSVPGWNRYGLDMIDDGEYKPGSLYMEAIK